MAAEQLPPGAAELHSLLGVHEGHGTEDAEHGSNVLGDSTPANLPLAHDLVAEGVKTNPRPPIEIVEHDAESNTYTVNLSNLTKINPARLLRKSLPYIAIFIIGIVAYVVLFTNFSFGSVFKSFTQAPASQKTAQAKDVPQNQLDAYNAWIRSYFFDVTDPKILDPNNDISGNGLTNYQKFLLGLNPKKKDTLGLGRTDTEDLVMGIDPLTGLQLTDSQKNAIAQAVDLETISNQLTLQAASQTPQVAGASTQAQNSADRDEVVIDEKINGKLDIPALKISVPLIWTQDAKSVDTDLQNGVIHLPGTVLPGEIGNSYISGHSSNYIWAKGSYNKIFSTLGDLKKYDSINVTATDVNGKQVIFHYVVRESGIFKADDQTQFQSIGKPTISLSTCWPVGTNSKRLVVFADLSQIEK